MQSPILIEDYLLRLGVTLLLGATIGVERQWRQKHAGLRTNTLVAVGSASFILLSLSIIHIYGGDPSRISAQIVTGIGFLGAGVIIKDGFNVRGLNTAATIWCSAAIGSLAGLGLFMQAGISTIAVLIINILLRPISIRLAKKTSYRNSDVNETLYQATIHCTPEKEAIVRSWLLNYIEINNQLSVRSIDRDVARNNTQEIIIQLEVNTIGNQNILLENLVTNLITKHEVIHAGWKILNKETEY